MGFKPSYVTQEVVDKTFKAKDGAPTGTNDKFLGTVVEPGQKGAPDTVVAAFSDATTATRGVALNLPNGLQSDRFLDHTTLKAYVTGAYGNVSGMPEYKAALSAVEARHKELGIPLPADKKAPKLQHQ